MTDTKPTPRTAEFYAKLYDERVPQELVDAVSKDERQWAEKLEQETIELKRQLAERDRQIAEAQRDAAVGAVIKKAARDLPEYYELEITIECGAASVYLRNPDGETSCIDRDSDNRLAAEINAAIDAAIQEQKK